MIAMMEELLTPEEVAKFLKVSDFTVRDMLRRKELKGVKVRGQWRVRPEDLRAYVNRSQDNK